MRKPLTLAALAGTLVLIGLAASSTATATTTAPLPKPPAAPTTPQPALFVLDCGPGVNVNGGNAPLLTGEPVAEPRTDVQIIRDGLGQATNPRLQAALQHRRGGVTVHDHNWRQTTLRDEQGRLIGAWMFRVHPGGLSLAGFEHCAG